MPVSRSKFAQFLVPFAVLMTAALIGTYLVMSRPQARPNPPAEKIQPVSIVSAQVENFRPSLLVYGEIAAGREAEIRSMVAGRIVAVDANFRSGSAVLAGHEFVEIDRFEFDVAVREKMADVDEADAKLREVDSELRAQLRFVELLEEQIKLRERDRDRTANLAKKNQSSEKALDDAEIALNATAQQLVQAEQRATILAARERQQHAQIARATAQLERANRDLADTKIAAPFTGYLQDVSVALGKRVAVGESLGKLIDADALEVRFELPNADYARLLGANLERTPHPLSGITVKVIWRLGTSNYTYDAEIERVGAEVDSSTGGIVLYARVARAAADILRPGAFVEVLVPDVAYEDVIVLPESAVSDQRIIYLVEDSRLVPREIEIVREFDDQVIVKGDVRANAAIVAEQFPDIGPGIRVSTD